MRLLVAAATTFELSLFRQHLAQHFEQINENLYCKDNLEIYVCITGVGCMITAFQLLSCVHSFNPHFCLQAGVAGAFNRELQPGQLVIVQSETLGDLGAEDNGKYIDVFDLNIMSPGTRPFSNRQLINTFQDFPLKLNLRFVSSLTVNTVSGSTDTIRWRSERFGCDIESMEGAAFHYVCLKQKIPFLQVRSISNYVEPRDKSKWKMAEAIENLNRWMIANIPE